MFIEHCKQLHPNWEIIVWTDERMESLPSFSNLEAFKAAANFGMKSDILRYEILRQYGGVYSDVDYEWLRPLDDICSRCSFFAGLANTAVVEVNNGFIGSTPNHPLIIQIIHQVAINCQQLIEEQQRTTAMSSLFASFLSPEESKNLTTAQQESSFNNTIKCTGPGMLTREISSYFSKISNTSEANELNTIVIFEKEVFSVIPNSVNVSLSDDSEENKERLTNIRVKYITDKSIAIHWWQKSWYSK